jgi:hypothetical protein
MTSLYVHVRPIFFFDDRGHRASGAAINEKDFPAIVVE